LRQLEDKTFIWLVTLVSLAFIWVLWPFSGAILWATVLAVLFSPVYRSINAGTRGWRNLAAFLTLALILIVVILPFLVVANLVIREGASVYADVAAGRIDLTMDLPAIRSYLPEWLNGLLDRIELPDPVELRERLSALLVEGGQFLAGQAITIGQTTFHVVVSVFVMLYLLFFLLRDGRELSRRIGEAIPLDGEPRQALFSRFALTINAIVKGSIVVALVQGALGGLVFWALGIRSPVLWGALMALFALLPVVGTSLVWAPVAVYLLATGSVARGVVLFVFGVLVIGLVDNLLRPKLIGKDTKIPDYLVLISTLGGIATFGANGFVVGPVIAALFLAAWSVFPAMKRERGGPPAGPQG
jgi:predicted PurR-regulated permease PerM